MPLLTTLPGRTAMIDGAEWLYASGTAYLGVVKDEGFRQLLTEGFDRYGMHYGGSRRAAIRLDIFEEAERWLARLVGAQDALVISSGTVAGQLAAHVLRNEGHPLLAPETHPALWSKARPYEGSRRAWIRRVLDRADRWEGGLVLFSNALDGMRARAYDFSWLGDLPPELPVALVVDESHAIGVLGPDGGGSYRTLQAFAPQANLLVTGSLGKAFGIPAGFIAGQKELIDSIRDSPIFGGASPPSPAWLYAMVQATELYRDRRHRLRQRLRQFRTAIEPLPGFSFLTHFPAVYSAQADLGERLAARQILISSFPYPTAHDPPVQRIVLNALHTEGDVERLAAAVYGTVRR